MPMLTDPNTAATAAAAAGKTPMGSPQKARVRTKRTASKKGPNAGTSKTPAVASKAGPASPKKKNNTTNLLQAAQGPAGSPSTSPVRKAVKRSEDDSTAVASKLKNPSVTPTVNTKRSNDGTAVETASGRTLRSQGTVTPKLPHNHVIVTLGFEPQNVDHASNSIQVDFLHNFKNLFGTLKSVDSTVVIVPLNPNDRTSPVIRTKSQVPPDMTQLNLTYFNTQPYMFKAKTDRSTGETSIIPIWGTFALSCTKEPERVLKCSLFKWQAVGGIKLEISDTQCATSSPAGEAYFVHSKLTLPIIQEEAYDVFTSAFNSLVADGELPDKFNGDRVPEVFISAKKPRVPGQQRRKKDEEEQLTYKQREAQKVLIIEVDESELALASLLVDKATQMGLWKSKWGRWALVTAPLVKGDPLVAKQRQEKTRFKAQKFIRGTAPAGIEGIHCIDQPVNVYDDNGSISKSYALRPILLHMIRAPDGSPLFASVHQGVGMSDAEVVIPEGYEYQRIVEMMNKNAAAFLFYYLTTVCTMDEAFVRKLVENTTDADAVAEIDDCDWDVDTLTLVTPQEREVDAQADDLMEQPWMIELDKVKEDNVQKRQNATFKLDDHMSLGTMHPQNDEKRQTAVQFGDTFDAKGLLTASNQVNLLDSDDEEMSAAEIDPTGHQPNEEVQTSPHSTNPVQDSDKEMARVEEATDMV